MMDGLDGLASGIALIAILLILPLLVGAHPQQPHTLLAAVLIAGIGGFLIFNMPARWNRDIRCFMGDAGSTLLGFSVAWVLISSGQGPSSVAAPITLSWLIAVPASDLVWSVIRRLLHGQSPIKPDKLHLHHVLMRAGLPAYAVMLILTTAAAILGVIGLSLEASHVRQSTSGLLLVASCTLLVLGVNNAHRWTGALRRDHASALSSLLQSQQSDR
jgi:UDP-GlcNAc:undecaprenyl-phosphate GlcNAc-1-phosphate transferase